MLTRRSFLRTSAIALGAAGAAPTWLLRAAAQGKSGRKILVAIFRAVRRWLEIVVPVFELGTTRYVEHRHSAAWRLMRSRSRWPVCAAPILQP